MFALLTDPKDPEFVQTPLFTSKESTLQRIGNFTLSADGDLEGDVREILSGNKAADWRKKYSDANNDERESALRENLKARFAEFELTNAKFYPSPDVSKGVSVVIT